MQLALNSIRPNVQVHHVPSPPTMGGSHAVLARVSDMFEFIHQFTAAVQEVTSECEAPSDVKRRAVCSRGQCASAVRPLIARLRSVVADRRVCRATKTFFFSSILSECAKNRIADRPPHSREGLGPDASDAPHLAASSSNHPQANGNNMLTC